MKAVAELLHGASKPDDLRVLSCAGFFHFPSQFSFGLMYDFPTGISTNPQTSCRSLSSILEETKNRRNRPSLNDRFGLAWMMASSLLDSHKASWMHKGISAYNVLFFHPPDLPSQCWLENPYIISFNGSRPDDLEAFTFTANTDLKSQSYQHPRYLSEKIRFCMGFDYYSLGVVLLAIGLWQTVEEMTAKLRRIPGEDPVEHLL